MGQQVDKITTKRQGVTRNNNIQIYSVKVIRTPSTKGHCSPVHEANHSPKIGGSPHRSCDRSIADDDDDVGEDDGSRTYLLFRGDPNPFQDDEDDDGEGDELPTRSKPTIPLPIRKRRPSIRPTLLRPNLFKPTHQADSTQTNFSSRLQSSRLDPN